MKKLLKNKWFLACLAFLVLGGSLYAYNRLKRAKADAARYITQAVTKGTITSAVSGTGQIAATDQVDIKPLTSGTYTAVKVQQGQAVKAGDAIAALDSQTAANQVNSARASLAQAQANYDKVLAGTSGNDIAAAQLSVTAAQQALAKAKQDYQNTATTQQQAVSKAHSNLLNNALAANASNTYTSASVTLSGSYLGQDEGKYVVSLYNTGGGLYYSSTGLGTESGPLIRGVALPLGNGLYITFGTSDSFDTSTTWEIDLPNKADSSYLTELNAYNSALETQKEDSQAAQHTIDSDQNALDQANITLSTKTAPPLASDVASAKASLQSAQVNLANAETAYANTIVRAPFDGVIAKVSGAAGDQANPSTAVCTEVTKQQLAEITLNEVDAAKVKPGQKSTLTMSAIPNFSLTGTVAQVDALGTVTQNVVNFTVKISLDTQDDRIKPGMSAAAEVITDVKQDVLKVPSAAVKTSGGQSYVQELANGQPQQIPVTVGLTSSTETEVSGNIKEGDEVVTQTITAASANSSARTATGNSLIPGLGGGGAVFRAGGGGGFGGGAGGARGN